MISISKPKLLSLTIISLFLLVPVIGSVHALYEVTLPANTLYADDFNEFTSGTDLGNGYGNGVNGCPSNGPANQCAGKYGWGWYDNAIGGYRHISNNNSYSGPNSLEMASSNQLSPNGKFDMHRLIPTTNTTTQITLSVWFSFDNFTYNGNGANGFTFSIETWDYINKYECVIFFYPVNPNVQVDTPDALPGGGFLQLRMAAYDDTRNIYATGWWHHLTMTCDIKNHKYLSVQIDNWDILKALGVNTATAHPLADTEMLRLGTPFTIPARIEFAQVNGGTSGSVKIWHKWMDDVVVTDTTPGQPNIIQFGIVSASGLFQLILITTAMMYVSSGFGTVMRVFAKDKVPKFLGPKFIIITGVVGTAGFLFMLIVGANLVQPACPPHFTCVG